MVFYRRAAQSQTMISAEQARSFRGESSGIFDRLGFVENTVVEAQILELQGIAPQGAVGCQHDIVAIEVISRFQPRAAGVIKHAQLGCKARRFGLPMKHQTVAQPPATTAKSRSV